MSDFSNGLTDAESERLAILAEECAEVQQVVSKILRHGYASYHPNNPNLDNRQLLEKELGDLANSVDMLVQAEDIDGEVIEIHQDRKSLTIKQYLHHQ